nr:VanZ family protein [Conchiformibius kuhniae]
MGVRDKYPFLNKWLILSMLWWCGGVYALVWREGGGVPVPPFPHFDKVAHFALFFAQTWLLAKAWLCVRRPVPVWGLAVFALCNAVASEWAQAAFTVSRQADVWDGLADMAGAGAALYAARVLENIRARRGGRG